MRKSTTIRTLVSICCGLLIGAGLVAAVQALGNRIWDVPEGLATADPAAMAQYIRDVPLAAKAWVVLSWGVGMASGAMIAHIVSRGALWASGCVIAVLLLFTVMNFLIVPHPVWMMIAPVILALSIWIVMKRAA